jgi:hypothetical protein
MLLEDKQLFKFGVVMTIIYMIFLVLFIISFRPITRQKPKEAVDYFVLAAFW